MFRFRSSPSIACTVTVHTVTVYAVMVAVSLSGIWGCSREESIRQYTVARAESETTPQISAPSVNSGKMAWFVKLTGPAAEVKELVEPFSEIVESFQVSEDGTPGYKTPESWETSSGPPPRFQTISIPDTEPALEVTVSSLPLASVDAEQYLLANINRWRGQLKLDPMSGADWQTVAEEAGEYRSIPSRDQTVAMVHLTGETKDYGESRMLAAIILPDGQRAAPVSPSASRPSQTTSPLKYDTPEGWEVSAGSSMRLASFRAGDIESPVDISVTRFPGGGDVLANINRWRGQVKLDPLKEAELDERIEKMTIGGREGLYSDILGEESAILAAIVVDGDAKWFFKAQGPKDAIVAEQEHFKQFLESIEFVDAE